LEVEGWARRAAISLEESLKNSEKVAIILPPTPDGISSSVILSEICSQLGVDSEFIVSLPETFLDAIEHLIGKFDHLIFLELPPHGPGPISVARELFKGLIVIDHGSSDLPGDILRVGLNYGGICTSLLLYMISSQIGKDNEYLSWIAVSGFKNKCTSKICEYVKERSQLYWPDLIEEASIDLIQRMLSAASFEGEDWIMMAISSLQESAEDPWWFIRGSSVTASILRSKVPEVEAKIKDSLSEPFLLDGSVGIWEVSEPHQRFVLSIEARKFVDVAITFFYDPPLGLVYMLAPDGIDLYSEAIELLRGESEWSAFGGMGFLSMIIDSERMVPVLTDFKDRLNSILGRV
jgi:hypothetical protein